MTIKVLALILCSTIAVLNQCQAAEQTNNHILTENEQPILPLKNLASIQYRMSFHSQAFLKSRRQQKSKEPTITKLRRRKRENEELPENVAAGSQGSSDPDPAPSEGMTNSPIAIPIVPPTVPGNVGIPALPTLPPPPSLDSVNANSNLPPSPVSGGSSFLPSMDTAKEHFDNMSKQAKEISTSVANAIGEFVNSVTGVFNNVVKG